MVNNCQFQQPRCHGDEPEILVHSRQTYYLSEEKEEQKVARSNDISLFGDSYT